MRRDNGHLFHVDNGPIYSYSKFTVCDLQLLVHFHTKMTNV